MINLQGTRGSGRTSRMLFDAVNTGIGKERFRKIKIFCVDPQHIREELGYYFNEHILSRIDLIKIDFKTLQQRTIGLDPKSYYVDHYVYQQYLENLPDIQIAIRGATKYDN